MWVSVFTKKEKSLKEKRNYSETYSIPWSGLLPEEGYAWAKLVTKEIIVFDLNLSSMNQTHINTWILCMNKGSRATGGGSACFNFHSQPKTFKKSIKKRKKKTSPFLLYIRRHLLSDKSVNALLSLQLMMQAGGSLSDKALILVTYWED